MQSYKCHPFGIWRRAVAEPGGQGLLSVHALLTLKIVDEDGRALGVGEEGELYIRGDNVTDLIVCMPYLQIMKGYLNVPREQTFDSEGYFPTGALGLYVSHISSQGTLREWTRMDISTSSTARRWHDSHCTSLIDRS